MMLAIKNLAIFTYFDAHVIFSTIYYRILVFLSCRFKLSTILDIFYYSISALLAEVKFDRQFIVELSYCFRSTAI